MKSQAAIKINVVRENLITWRNAHDMPLNDADHKLYMQNDLKIWKKNCIFQIFYDHAYIMWGKNFLMGGKSQISAWSFCLFKSFSFEGPLLCKLLQLSSLQQSLLPHSNVIVLLGGLIFMKPYHLPGTLNVLSHLILRT